ncbi:MAG TPA: TRAP transporter substrate-binding protein [Casimicrobium sp.]|nr:TRAP transporter substrate-binding protein [Casimicrobium sp.]
MNVPSFSAVVSRNTTQTAQRPLNVALTHFFRIFRRSRDRLSIVALALLTSYCGAALAANEPADGAKATSPPLQTLRIVGGLAGAGQYARMERPFWTVELPKISNGKFNAEVVPFDRAGIPGQDLLRMMQIGVIPFGTTLLSHMATVSPQFNAPDLGGLHADIGSLRRAVTAFRPYLKKTLREQYNVELLSVYTYPAQVIFCQKPLASLADMKGRRVRVASATGADFMRGLGATPVITEYSEIMRNMASGNTECAVTAAKSGNSIGLHEKTKHLYNLPITWGLSVFAANSNAWRAIHPELRTLLERELPLLEERIWSASERDTVEGIACNTGVGLCESGTKGTMVLSQPTPADTGQREQILRGTVLKNWVQRCGEMCSTVWNEMLSGSTRLRAAAPN